MDTIVLQSHRPDRLNGWLGRCCSSVAEWAEGSGFAYERSGDELFDRIPIHLRDKFSGQPVVLSDLARLLWLQEKLGEGYARAIWCDADLLIFRPFAIVESGDTFGRECWVQGSAGRLRVYRKIHNAWMQFERGSATLAFYIERAMILLDAARAPVVPQFIGPKLLTAWHNIAPFAVDERVGMLSPRVMADLLNGGEEALGRLRDGHDSPIHALNLSASFEGRDDAGICHHAADFERLITGLLDGDMSARL